LLERRQLLLAGGAGFNMLGENPPNERQNRVIFLSDGLATVGITGQDQIISMATGFITKGIGLTTVGVGNSFDVNLMRGLAERGAGNFYFVEDAAAATEVFTDELEYFMAPLAMDLRIEAKASDGWDFKSVIGTKLWTAAPKTGSMSVPAVFLASRVDQQPDPNGGRRGGGSMIFIQMEPHTNSAGRVAELTLSYRAPNQTERVTQTIVVDYDRDPSEMLEEPYLSYPAMSERYAMYNMFLGFKLATHYAQSNYSCASAVLTTIRRNAQSWGERYTGDPDIAADMMLMDQFISNLATKGAPQVELSSCPAADQPYPDDLGGYGDDTYAHSHCSAGKASPSWLVLLGVVLLVVRRRRRR
jgi:Ca-activated chloride channel family protein